MGIYRNQQPPPFIGGMQPHAPLKMPPSLAAVQVDEPPYQLGGPFAVTYLLVRTAQPQWGFVVWHYILMGGKQPYAPSWSDGRFAVRVDEPPYQFGGPFAIKHHIVAQTQPAWATTRWPYTFMGEQQPYAPRRLTQAPPAVNNPPFGHRARTAQYASLVRAWDAPPFRFHMTLYSSDIFPRGLIHKPQARGYIIL